MDTKSKTIVTAGGKIPERSIGKEAALVTLYGQDLGRRFVLQKSEVVIGRSSKCDIRIDQESVSRNHASLLNNGRSVVLRDLGSTNGTLVNDQQVDEYVLRHGDLIKIGRTVFKFIAGGDIEQLYHEEIYRLTTTDGLTQIFNKRYFLEQLEREMGRCQRYGRTLTLSMLDVDHFKEVNDTFGHLIGDQVLKQLATLLQGRIRREDLLARYGGEELVVALPELGLAQGLLLAEQLRHLVESHRFRVGDIDIKLTISIGVVQLKTGLLDPNALLREVDAKLYEAKARGRNRVCG
jgi:two-component system cell cycle response regulator